MRITIVGAGYVGLVAGACYASTGNTVTMVDADPDKVDMLTSGGVPIYEPGLGELLAESVRAGRITFTTDLPGAIKDAEIIGIAVGTPSADDGSVDMSYVDEAARQIGQSIQDYCLVVTKSTVPVGTHQRVTDIIRSQTDVPFDYVSNPEFLKEGAAVDDFLTPDRVIVGTNSDRARKAMKHLYQPFMRRGNRILFMDPTSAELTKYACNAMLATRISFMNELARLSNVVGADVEAIRAGMGSDNRIGRAFLYPGLGYGGSCFPKDVRALIHMSRQAGTPFGTVEATHEANEAQADHLLDKIRRYYNDQLDGRRFAVWGLSFKPRTDDMREAPSVKIITRLLEASCSVAVHDPQAHHTARKILGDSVEYCDDAYDPLQGADGLIICTEWMEFRTPDFARMATLLTGPVIFDGRNLYDPAYVNESGLDYLCIGRPDAMVSH